MPEKRKQDHTRADLEERIREINEHRIKTMADIAAQEERLEDLLKDRYASEGALIELNKVLAQLVAEDG